MQICINLYSKPGPNTSTPFPLTTTIMAYCNRCSRSFTNDRALEQHEENSNAHWICHDCWLDFESYSQLEKHDHSVHDYCTQCRRGFINQNNLQQHLNSKTHRPETIPCPGRGCDRTFISVAALTLHFESGTCPSGMTRAELDRRVVRADRNHYITNPDRLICGPGGCEPPSTTSWATDRSWNVNAWECFLCHSTFKNLAGLNQHLRSAFHNEKIYRCPKSDCRLEFKTLSALCQHVEGGSCGVRVFRQVRDTMDSLTRGFNAITL
ncbi:hypothetical protein EI94DRAFT_1745694 [Lactarius quietus]|nr:hypothetical protein EI94DRAFT_1745694 [Lactarius quietus]